MLLGYQVRYVYYNTTVNVGLIIGRRLEHTNTGRKFAIITGVTLFILNKYRRSYGITHPN